MLEKIVKIGEPTGGGLQERLSLSLWDGSSPQNNTEDSLTPTLKTYHNEYSSLFYHPLAPVGSLFPCIVWAPHTSFFTDSEKKRKNEQVKKSPKNNNQSLEEEINQDQWIGQWIEIKGATWGLYEDVKEVKIGSSLKALEVLSSRDQKVIKILK